MEALFTRLTSIKEITLFKSQSLAPTSVFPPCDCLGKKEKKEVGFQEIGNAASLCIIPSQPAGQVSLSLRQSQKSGLPEPEHKLA